MYKYIFVALITPMLTTANALAEEKFSIFGVTPGKTLTQEQLNATIEHISANIQLAEDAKFPVIDTNQTQPYLIYKYPLYGEVEKFSMTLVAIPKERLYIVNEITLQAHYAKLSDAPTLESLKSFVFKKYGEISHVLPYQIRKDGTSNYSDYRVAFKSGDLGHTADSVKQCRFSDKNENKEYFENCKTIMYFDVYAKPLKADDKNTLMANNFQIRIIDIEVESTYLAQKIRNKKMQTPY